jgi:hypothetical protein
MMRIKELQEKEESNQIRRDSMIWWLMATVKEQSDEMFNQASSDSGVRRESCGEENE